MTNLAIARTLRNDYMTDDSMLLGFRRWASLPMRVRKDIGTAYFLKTGETNQHDYVVSFFENMTEIEFISYMKQA